MTDVANLIDSIFGTPFGGRLPGVAAFPPCNIDRYKTAEAVTFVITMAVAGYKKDQLEAFVDDDILVIRSGEVHSSPDDVHESRFKGTYSALHTGIARRHFIRKFQLSPNTKVDSLNLEDGILTVVLVEKMPEVKKPKMLMIEGA